MPRDTTARAHILRADARALPLPNDSVDAIVTDPPYGLEFMGKEWDHGVPGVAFWTEALRVAKPGAHMLAFGGTRTYHRLACAVEDAGWEIRDCIMWVYSSGFPKSHNLSGDWQGWGTALKPAYEPIIVARKPPAGTVAQNVLRYGTGAINVDGCRIGASGGVAKVNPDRRGAAFGGIGFGCNGDTVPVGGRWPANLIHDGSEEVLAGFPETGVSSDHPRHNGEFKSVAKGRETPHTTFGHSDSGSAARFFYCAKASKSDRGRGNNHPTVKPLALMRYLCRLVTPPGGLVLDPFCGSGTTVRAAVEEGFRAIGSDFGYHDIALRRTAEIQRPLIAP